MAYKITKYGGKHKIKDTKTGESVEIDIKKYLNGGTDPKTKTTTERRITDEEARANAYQNNPDSMFTEDGLKMLGYMNDSQYSDIPPLDLGKYKDVGYFNVGYSNGEYNISPTNRNPGNADKYKEYLTYLQKQNPNAIINRRGHDSGYVPFGNRMEHGGMINKYATGGEPCEPWDYVCQEEQRKQAQSNMTGNPMLPSYLQANATQIPQNNVANYTPNQTVPSNNGMVDEGTVARERITGVNALTPQPGTIDYNTIQKPDISGSLRNRMATTDINNNPTENQEENYNMFNPYAGVDIPTAAYTLGQSIKDKNTLGIVGSGLKLATGLGRNLVSGLGQANRYNQVMQDYYKDQKNNRNQFQYMANGGKRDEELATGEYMQGIENENIHAYNAEVEAGEYFQTNEGDIAEIVGDKHSQGGENIQMEQDDRVLSDKLKLGAKAAKELSEKYDINLKAANTYSDVLDKFRRKSKLDKIIEEEADILKKIDEQAKVEDAVTKNFNLEVLTKKQQEILDEKHPIEEQRKVIFDELFDMQEASKPKSKENKKGEFEFGGNFEALAKEYNIPVERAKELIQSFSKGGKIVPKYADGDPGAAYKSVPEGQSETEVGFFGKVSPEQFERFKRENSWWFDFSNFDPTKKEDVARLQKTYNSRTDGNPVKVDGLFGEQTASLFLSPSMVTAQGRDIPITAGPLNNRRTSVSDIQADAANNSPVIDERNIRERNAGLMGAYLFPDETPLPPSALQGTIKPERRFDRVNPTEINVEPYLQDIRDREQAQVQSLEGLSPNVRAAVLANMRATNQGQESNIRNQIDTQNLQSQERANYTNAQIQSREENASAADRLAYEQRQYRAQALTDNDLNNYYNQLQSINKSRFMDIQNLNMINSTNPDVYFDGQSYQRKNTDQELMDRYLKSKGLR